MAISLEIPNSEQAIGISSRDPPATPEAPQAAKVESTLRIKAVGMSTAIPIVCAQASVITDMVIAAPSILMVAPSGMDTEYISSSRPRRLQSDMLIGIFAAELLVKNAVMPLSLIHFQISGYGFLCR